MRGIVKCGASPCEIRLFYSWIPRNKGVFKSKIYWSLLNSFNSKLLPKMRFIRKLYLFMLLYSDFIAILLVKHCRIR